MPDKKTFNATLKSFSTKTAKEVGQAPEQEIKLLATLDGITGSFLLEMMRTPYVKVTIESIQERMPEAE